MWGSYFVVLYMINFTLWSFGPSFHVSLFNHASQLWYVNWLLWKITYILMLIILEDMLSSCFCLLAMGTSGFISPFKHKDGILWSSGWIIIWKERKAIFSHQLSLPSLVEPWCTLNWVAHFPLNSVQFSPCFVKTRLWAWCISLCINFESVRNGF